MMSLLMVVALSLNFSSKPMSPITCEMQSLTCQNKDSGA